MELLWYFIVAGVLVSDWFADVKDAMFGKGFPRHERRKQQREHDHELRKLRLQQRHAERLAGKAGPTIGEAVAHRIRTSRPKTRDEMHGFRAWWWDLSDDTAKRLTAERRARHDRNARGEGDAQRAWQWTVRHAKAWQERNQARRSGRGEEQPPPTVQADAQRTDWPDPGAPSEEPMDAEVVDDPKPGPPPRSQRPELEPGWPEWGESRNTEPESMPCPDCRGVGCGTCGDVGRVPSWLADPAVKGGAAWAVSPESENPPGTARAVAERIPKPLGGNSAEHTNSSTNDGGPDMGVTDGIKDLGHLVAAEGRREPERERNVRLLEQADPEKGAVARRQLNEEYARRGLTPSGLPIPKGGVPRQGGVATAGGHGGGTVHALNGETVDPESLGGFASGMQQVAAAMQASIEASVANLTNLGVSGQPIDDLMAMADAAATLAGRSQSTATAAARHSDIQGVAHSDPTVGGEQYLGIGAARR